jgi:hypothetical protein
MALTQWFEPEVIPVHTGVYQRGVPRISDTMFGYAYWDGKDWYVSGKTPAGALRYYRLSHKSILTNPSWRGIAEESI